MYLGHPRWKNGKEYAANTGDTSSPGLGGSPGEGNGKPLQYSCLEDSMDRGAWWATMHEVAKNRTQVSVLAHTGARVHTHTHADTHAQYAYCDPWISLFNPHSLGVGHSY